MEAYARLHMTIMEVCEIKRQTVTYSEERDEGEGVLFIKLQ